MPGVAPSRVQRWDIKVDLPAGPNDLGMLNRVHAAGKLHAVAEALGALRVKLLEAVLVKDLAWTEIGRLLRVSDKTARDHTVEAIATLADWLAGRAVAPQPVIRFRNQPSSW